MQKRRRFRQVLSLKERLLSFAEEMRERASELPPGPEREDVLKKARQAEIATHLDEWANSPGLQPPRR